MRSGTGYSDTNSDSATSVERPLRVYLFLNGLASHFGPGQQVVTMAKALMARGHEVRVFVEQPVASDNEYLLGLLAAGVVVRRPGWWLTQVEKLARINEMVWLLLAPIRLLIAVMDVLIRQRTFHRAWNGVRGRFDRLLPQTRFAEPCRWAMIHALNTAHNEHPADLIHTLSGMGCSFAWSQKVGLPLVHTEMAIPTVEHGVDWWPDLRDQLETVDEMTAVSNAVAQGIRNHFGYRGPISVIPNMVAITPVSAFDSALTEPARARPENCLVIGVAARLDPMKGHRFLVEAVPQLLTSVKEIGIEVWLTGDGPARPALQAQIAELRLASVVKLLGHCDASWMDFFWKSIDLFVLPTLWEGLPVAVIESMAHMKPVVASAVDGVPEVVEHGVTGLLVPPADPAALAQAMSALLRSPETRQRMGYSGYQKYLSSYHPDAVIMKQVAAYRRVLESR